MPLLGLGGPVGIFDERVVCQREREGERGGGVFYILKPELRKDAEKNLHPKCHNSRAAEGDIHMVYSERRIVDLAAQRWLRLDTAVA